MIQRQEVIASQEKHNVIETAAHSVKHIKCQQGGYRRRLADVTMQGIFLWCKECRRSHLVTWEELFLLQQEFQPKLVVISAVEQIS